MATSNVQTGTVLHDCKCENGTLIGCYLLKRVMIAGENHNGQNFFDVCLILLSELFIACSSSNEGVYKLFWLWAT